MLGHNFEIIFNEASIYIKFSSVGSQFNYVQKRKRGCKLKLIYYDLESILKVNLLTCSSLAQDANIMVWTAFAPVKNLPDNN